jgi:hypothetical protein
MAGRAQLSQTPNRPRPLLPKVAKGLAFPLEVFKTPAKGYGVRSPIDLPVGAALCPYLGEVYTDT